MAVTASDLQALFGAGASDLPRLEVVLARAEALVDTALEDAWRPMPEALRDECVTRTAYALFNTLGTSDGGNMLGADATPIAGVANDPLQKSWPLIRRFINRV